MGVEWVWSECGVGVEWVWSGCGVGVEWAVEWAVEWPMECVWSGCGCWNGLWITEANCHARLFVPCILCPVTNPIVLLPHLPEWLCELWSTEHVNGCTAGTQSVRSSNLAWSTLPCHVQDI